LFLSGIRMQVIVYRFGQRAADPANLRQVLHAGSGNALQTAEAMNRIDPDFIRIRTLAIPAGVDLYRDLQMGIFTPLNDQQMAAELLLFLDRSEEYSEDSEALGEDFAGARLYRLGSRTAERLDLASPATYEVTDVHTSMQYRDFTFSVATGTGVDAMEVTCRARKNASVRSITIDDAAVPVSVATK